MATKQLRDSKGRFVKIKLSYKDLEVIIESQKTLIAELEKTNNTYDFMYNALCDFLEKHLPFWKKKALSKFKEDITETILGK